MTATWAYDLAGRATAETLKIGAGGTVRTVSSGYTDQRRTSITYPNGRAVEVDWWAAGALKSVKDSGAPTAIAAYEWIGGRLGDRMSQNGVDLYLFGCYDAAGRPAYWYHYNLQDESCDALGFDYTYDRVGNKLSQKSYHDPKDSQRYAYDSASRLTAWVRGGFGQWVYQNPNWVYLDGRCDPSNSQPPAGMTQAQRWDLDGVGNWSLTRTKVNNTTTNDARGDTTFNEYTTVGSPAQTQSYDDNGNLTGDGSKTYKWDAFNRLREVWTAGGSPTKIVTYTYDAGNRRVRKDLVNNTYAPDIDYVYDGWRIVEEHENAAANPSKQFVFGAYIDEPLVMDVNTDGDTSCVDAGGSLRLFYCQNTIYSVYALTDADGALVDVLEYDPYGRHWLLEPGEDGEYFTSDDGDPYPLALPAYASPFLFTGREFDGETGLHCYRNRYFNFRSGSFTGRDPAGFRPGVNLYGYCNLNPECLLDPFGLACSWAVGRCIRNVSNITVPTSYHGIPIPAWARAATNAVIPDHQNVKIVSYKGENLTGEEDESVVRGFFADDFNGAVSEYALSLIPLAGFNGWVPGHVASDENPGACWLASVSRARYDLIKRRMLANHDTEYHLTTYNCQHWATRQLL